MKHFILSLAALMLASTAACAQLLHTTCRQGEIAGELHNGYALYKAIPYAEAPVGSLRWHAPVAKAAWTGVYKADDWAPRPMQPAQPGPDGSVPPMSEDCLYLSVATPARTTDERLPVFVNIHGGAFISGTYSGTQDSFVSQGIVYCSIAYRLGVFGFMAHPEAAGESPVGSAGNYGILDQIMALQWIHDNIDRFGGDPDRITICGESAGGISVSILCGSPLCKGLFRRAISESGGNFAPIRKGPDAVCGSAQDMAYAQSLGLDLQKALGCKNLKQMRKLPAEKIMSHNAFERFWPLVDGYAITGDQYEAYERGDFNDVELMAGYNSDEGALFIHGQGMDAYRRSATTNFSLDPEGFAKAYPATDDAQALQALRDIFRDAAFGWNTWAWVNLQSAKGKQPVYFYYFDQLSDNTPMRGTRGAVHVAEMPFIYSLDFGGKMSQTDTHMARIMESYWINFIKTGNPNADILPYWAPYRRDTPTTMFMHNGFYLAPAPNLAQMNFLENYFRLTRANNK